MHWKYYISSAFWSNISIPINFSITMITAVTTGEYASKTLLTSDTALMLSITALILSTVNTFFSPEKKLGETKEIMKTWERRGLELEKVRMLDSSSVEHLTRVIKEYRKLFEKVNELKRQQPNSFVTDFIYWSIRVVCLRLTDTRWIKSRYLKKWELDQESYSDYNKIINPDTDECCISITCLFRLLCTKSISERERLIKFEKYNNNDIWKDYARELFYVDSGDCIVNVDTTTDTTDESNVPHGGRVDRKRPKRRASITTLYSSKDSNEEDEIDMDSLY